MTAWQSLLVFTGQTLVIVIAILIVLITFFTLIAKVKDKAELDVESLNEHFKDLTDKIKSQVISKKLLKKELKAEAKQKKQEQKKAKKESDSTQNEKPRIFVLDFNGDLKAAQTQNLREEISGVLGLATPQDEIVLRLESPGGMVHAYGFAASQLQRIRNHNIPLTICIDKVAASGGYMMACVGSQILAAPFAIVGSIGVLAQVPNLHKLLKKHDIDYHEYTAGDYKRTISFFGEIHPEGEKKFLQQMEETHSLFKHFVEHHRPQLDIQKVATGEHWYGEQAIHLGLIDQIETSDEYLMKKVKDFDIYKIKYQGKKTLSEKISETLSHSLEKSVHKVLENTLYRLPHF